MMKYSQYITFLLLLIKINSINQCSGSASTLDDCEKKYTEEEKEYGHCCLFKAKDKQTSQTTIQCMELSNEDYESIDDVEDSYSYTYDNIEIDCKSYYLHLSLLLLLINFII